MGQDACHIKLTSGEEILGMLVHEDEEVTIVKDPLEIREDDEGYISLRRWCPMSGSNSVDFKSDFVAHTAHLDDRLTHYYLSSLSRLHLKFDKDFNEMIEKMTEGIDFMGTLDSKRGEPDFDDRILNSPVSTAKN